MLNTNIITKETASVQTRSADSHEHQTPEQIQSAWGRIESAIREKVMLSTKKPLTEFQINVLTDLKNYSSKLKINLMVKINLQGAEQYSGVIEKLTNYVADAIIGADSYANSYTVGLSMSVIREVVSAIREVVISDVEGILEDFFNKSVMKLEDRIARLEPDARKADARKEIATAVAAPAAIPASSSRLSSLPYIPLSHVLSPSLTSLSSAPSSSAVPLAIATEAEPRRSITSQINAIYRASLTRGGIAVPAHLAFMDQMYGAGIIATMLDKCIESDEIIQADTKEKISYILKKEFRNSNWLNRTPEVVPEAFDAIADNIIRIRRENSSTQSKPQTPFVSTLTSSSSLNMPSQTLPIPTFTLPIPTFTLPMSIPLFTTSSPQVPVTPSTPIEVSTASSSRLSSLPHNIPRYISPFHLEGSTASSLRLLSLPYNIPRYISPFHLEVSTASPLRRLSSLPYVPLSRALSPSLTSLSSAPSSSAVPPLSLPIPPQLAVAAPSASSSSSRPSQIEPTFYAFLSNWRETNFSSAALSKLMKPGIMPGILDDLITLDMLVKNYCEKYRDSKDRLVVTEEKIRPLRDIYERALIVYRTLDSQGINREVVLALGDFCRNVYEVLKITPPSPRPIATENSLDIADEIMVRREAQPMEDRDIEATFCMVESPDAVKKEMETSTTETSTTGGRKTTLTGSFSSSSSSSSISSRRTPPILTPTPIPLFTCSPPAPLPANPSTPIVGSTASSLQLYYFLSNWKEYSSRTGTLLNFWGTGRSNDLKKLDTLVKDYFDNEGKPGVTEQEKREQLRNIYEMARELYVSPSSHGINVERLNALNRLIKNVVKELSSFPVADNSGRKSTEQSAQISTPRR